MKAGLKPIINSLSSRLDASTPLKTIACTPLPAGAAPFLIPKYKNPTPVPYGGSSSVTQEVFSESGPNAVFVTMFDDNGAAINLDPKIVDDSGHKLSSLMSGLQFLPFNLELTSGTHTIYAKFAPPFNEVTGG